MPIRKWFYSNKFRNCLKFSKTIGACGLVIVYAVLATSCIEKRDFEKLTGPTSAPAIAMIAAGGLRDNLFPNSKEAFQTCFEDFTACKQSGGVSIQVTESGRKVIDNLKVMLALTLSKPELNKDFESHCAKLAQLIFEEPDDDAYEVSLRLLSFFTADKSSPLQCTILPLSQLYRKKYKSMWIDTDVLKLTAYAEAILLSRGLFLLRGSFSSGFLGRLVTLGLLGSSGVIAYNGASGIVSKLHIDRWISESATHYFVGTLNWNRKYEPTTALMVAFRNQLEGYFDNTTLAEASQALNAAVTNPEVQL